MFFSNSSRLFWNDFLLNIFSAYSMTGNAFLGSFIDNLGNLHKIGIMQQSTSEKPSLKKKDFFDNIGTILII